MQEALQEDPNEEENPQQYCSFAVTGTQTSFQAIYICRSCCTEDNVLCLCQACADSCHAECDGLEYIGVGPSYCDCHDISTGCTIQQRSLEEAARLHATNCIGRLIHCDATKADDPAPSHSACEYVMDAYSMPVLTQDNKLYRLLCQQAHELIKHSRETFWVDEALASKADLSALERMAWAIYTRHLQHYKLGQTGLTTPSNVTCGAEWWVQVKPISYPKSQADDSAHVDGQEAIDLHYDKDEVLAESFGLGLFPTLATVTYLTHAQGASPTMILSRRYDQQEDDVISTMFLSHPRRGKHIVFDGQLLHGAPSHYVLRESCGGYPVPAADAEYRITFLVNLWIGHHPANVQPLDANIRECLHSCATDQAIADRLSSGTGVGFEKQTVVQRAVRSIDNLEESGRERIHLPFLSKGATWEQDIDSGMQLVLSTFAPPRTKDDETTIQVHFGPGLEAMIEPPAMEEDGESGDEDDVEGDDSI